MSKVRNYPFEKQNERPFISIDRAAFKQIDTKEEVKRVKKEAGKSRRHKFKVWSVTQH